MENKRVEENAEAAVPVPVKKDVTTVITVEITVIDRGVNGTKLDDGYATDSSNAEGFRRVLSKILESDLRHFGDVTCNVTKLQEFVMDAKEEKHE